MFFSHAHANDPLSETMPDDLTKLVILGAFGFFIGAILMGWAYG